MNVEHEFQDLCGHLRRHPSALIQRQFDLRIARKPRDKKSLLQLQDRGLREEPLRSILKNRNTAGWWYSHHPSSIYKKYQGTIWSLLFAAEFGAPEKNPLLRESSEVFLDRCHVKETGAFEYDRRPSRTIPCFVAHACCFLVYFGFAKDHRVKNAWRWLESQVAHDGGLQCFVMDSCLNESCTMAVPKYLKAASVLSASERNLPGRAFSFLCTMIRIFWKR